MSAGLQPEPSTVSSTSSSIHSPDVERQAPVYLEGQGRIPVGTTPRQRSGNKLVRTAKWVVGYDDNAPESIGSEQWLGELFENPKATAVAYFRGLFPFLRWLPNYVGISSSSRCLSGSCSVWLSHSASWKCPRKRIRALDD